MLQQGDERPGAVCIKAQLNRDLRLGAGSTRYAAITIWPELDVRDYADRTAQTIEGWKGMNGKQGRRPEEARPGAGHASDADELPLRFIAGADAVEAVEKNLAVVQGQIDAHRGLSSSLSHDP